MRFLVMRRYRSGTSLLLDGIALSGLIIGLGLLIGRIHGWQLILYPL